MTRTANRRIRNLEARAGGPGMRPRYATLELTESLESALEAAESETGLSLPDIDPFTLPADVWAALTMAMLGAGIEIHH